MGDLSLNTAERTISCLFKAYNKQFEAYGNKFGAGDFIGCYIDFDNKQISYSVNGRYCGVAFENITLMSQQSNVVLYPCVVIKNGSVKFNFGSGDKI